MADPQLRPGALIDRRFLLGRRLGSGSTGVVWLAQDQHTNQEVALKLLHPKMSHDEMLVAQLAREADVLQQLDHPHIARSFAFQPNGPFVYLAMEFIDGKPLHEVIGAHTRSNTYFTHSQVIRMLGQLCDAVAYAHGKYIVHRDLKPQNVMVIGDGEGISIKVLDFGIARLLEGSIFDATTLGRQLGSLFYMSPEQTRGEPADVRSDVFALGVLLFELVTLRRAWAWDENDVPIPAFERPVPHGEANAIAAVFTRITSGRRPRASEVRLELPPAFDAVITRALAVRREDRFASVQEFATEAMLALKRITGSVEAPTELAPAVGMDYREAMLEEPLLESTPSPSPDDATRTRTNEYAKTAILLAADEDSFGGSTIVESDSAPLGPGARDPSASITAPPDTQVPRSIPETVEYRASADESSSTSLGKAILARQNPPAQEEERTVRPDEPTHASSGSARPQSLSPPGPTVRQSAIAYDARSYDDTEAPSSRSIADTLDPAAPPPEQSYLAPLIGIAIVSMLAAIFIGLLVYRADAPHVEAIPVPTETKRDGHRHPRLWKLLADMKAHPADKAVQVKLRDGIVASTDALADRELANALIACANGNQLMMNAEGLENCLLRLEAAKRK